MTLENFIELTNSFAVIETPNIRHFFINENTMRAQISRWCKTKKLEKLRSGAYILASTYRKKIISPLIAASTIIKPSYLSLEKALEYYGLIPEAVTTYTSVTTKRENTFTNSIGVFQYQHIQPSLFFAYRSLEEQGQSAFIAEPEKALLDTIYLKKIALTAAYLEQWRLQNLENIDVAKLYSYAKIYKQKFVENSTQILANYIEKEKGAYKTI